MRDELTEKEETYAQYRAAGYTKTDAAKKAYDTKNPKQQGYKTEQREIVKERILELKQERAEVASLDVDEQVRRYNEIYLIAMDKGKHETAMKALERMDSIGGFDAPSRNINMNVTGNDLKALKSENLKKDLERFSKIIGTHEENVIEVEEVKELEGPARGNPEEFSLEPLSQPRGETLREVLGRDTTLTDIEE